jgi:hypothetical protein
LLGIIKKIEKIPSMSINDDPFYSLSLFSGLSMAPTKKIISLPFLMPFLPFFSLSLSHSLCASLQ